MLVDLLQPILAELAFVFFGYLVLGLTGFGSALIVIPLLAWKMPIAEVVPVVLLLDVAASLLHSSLNARTVHWKLLPRLLPGVLAGAAFGILAIQHLNAHGLLAALGVYVILVGVKGARGIEVQAANTLRISHASWGFCMGAVETLFGTAGPLVLAWLARQRASPEAMRATVPAVIIGLSVLAIGSIFLMGTANREHAIRLALLLAPAALVGVWTGHALAPRIPGPQLNQLIFGLLIISGLSLTLRGVMSWLH